VRAIGRARLTLRYSTSRITSSKDISVPLIAVVL
jgi:hypothetical protein